ncbi:Alanine--tRNA ligase [archaeon HR04]|nr:Alanine--tRNA ligase [archaeon HR04]
MERHDARAHTAEHIFARTLQNMLGSENIQVLKVEHADDVNRVYIRCKELSMDDVYEAMLTVNRIIDEGRVVREYTFSSLDEARERFPDTRAYDARISGSVRVVEIDGYDHSACIREHVSNTRECKFFIVKGVSRERDLIKVEYLVGDDAKHYAIGSVARLAGIASMLKANTNTLEATLKNMLEELGLLRARMKKVTEDAVSSVSTVSIKGVNLYHGSFSMLDDDTLIKNAGMMIKGDEKGYMLVVFLNHKKDRANITIASNHPRLDCSALLKEMLARYGGKGGGKAEFATGYIHVVGDYGYRIKQEVIEFIERSV